MNNAKKLKKEKVNQAYEQAIEDLAVEVVNILKQDQESDLEAYESYKQKVKTNLYQNLDNYRERLSQGYNILLEEISKQAPDSDDIKI